MAKPYLPPYIGGVLLGLLLTLSFVIAGRGLGASGAVAQVLADSNITQLDPAGYLESINRPEPWWQSWIVIEVIGLIIGAFVSAKWSNRFAPSVIKGANTSTRRRFAFAITGGLLMGFAARLARGCTSGQALSGGVLLNTGSWAFMLAVFIGAYATCVFVKREWS